MLSRLLEADLDIGATKQSQGLSHMMGDFDDPVRSGDFNQALMIWGQISALLILIQKTSCKGVQCSYLHGTIWINILLKCPIKKSLFRSSTLIIENEQDNSCLKNEAAGLLSGF